MPDSGTLVMMNPVFERGVAQTLAECECRILREVGVTVAVLASNLVVVDRQLSCVTREGDRQASARFGFAENDFGDGLAALHARAWSPQQSRSAFGWSSSTITPLVPNTADAGSTCGLELTSTTTNGLPVSRATFDSASIRVHSVRRAVQAWRWSGLRQWPGSTSPTTATIRSLLRAFSTASPSSARSILAETPIFGRGCPSG